MIRKKMPIKAKKLLQEMIMKNKSWKTLKYSIDISSSLGSFQTWNIKVQPPKLPPAPPPCIVCALFWSLFSHFFYFIKDEHYKEILLWMTLSGSYLSAFECLFTNDDRWQNKLKDRKRNISSFRTYLRWYMSLRRKYLFWY